jgi:ABC-type branched-subunit amino acid transport system substrate-binding protein
MRKASIMFVILIIALAVASGLVVAACGSSSSSDSSASASAAPTGPIKVGHIVNLTGPEAMVGQGQAKALEAAFKTIGPINGRTVEVITEDAQGEAASAVDAARKLVENDHVVAIFGPTEIGQKAAVGNYIKSVSIPEIIYNPSPAEMFTGNKWIVGSGGAVPQCPSCMGDYLYSKGNVKTINTLTEDNSAGRAFMTPLTDVFTSEGGKVLKQQWVPENVGDFSPYLSTLPDADNLVAWEPGGAGIKLFIQWYGLGLYKTMPISAAYHGGFTDPFIPAALPPKVAAEVVGTLAPQFYYPSNPSPENQLMQKTLTPILGFPPADDGSSGPWQAALLFQAGVEANKGDTTGDTLVAAILGSTITGPEGTESFPNGAQFATKTVYILKVAAVPGHAKAFTYDLVDTYENVPPEGFSAQ